MLCLADVDEQAVRELLGRFDLELELVATGELIPGSYWGDSEAGLIGAKLFARPDTPVHSLLHEASHFVCMGTERRNTLHTDAGGDDLEESAVCLLQLALAQELPGVDRYRFMQDMDTWGYSFRLGSTRAWFEQDADDARDALKSWGLCDDAGRSTYRLRN